VTFLGVCDVLFWIRASGLRRERVSRVTALSRCEARMRRATAAGVGPRRDLSEVGRHAK